VSRYDAVEYLRAFRDAGRFPAIHNELFALILSEGRGAKFLDLCCSTGLLGERLARFYGASFVLGVDSDADALAAAREHGVRIQLQEMKISPECMGELGAVIHEHGITSVVARRCLPEIMGPWPEYDRVLAITLADAGVREVFIEGRVKTMRAVNRLSDVEKEAQVLASRYQVSNRRGSCLRMTLRESRPTDTAPAAGAD
jgi:hypothetical protein